MTESMGWLDYSAIKNGWVRKTLFLVTDCYPS